MRASLSPLPWLLTVSVLIALPARADLMLGNFSSDSTTPAPLHGYLDTADGNQTPMRTLAGPNTHLVEPTFGVYEPVEDVFYISDFRGQAIRVFAVGANGDTAPIRELTSPSIAQTRAVAVSPQLDLIAAIVSNCCVATWPRLANGNTAPSTFMSGFSGNPNVTQLNNPSTVAINPLRQELIVGDYDRLAPFTPKLLFFDRAATGNVAPLRVLQGPATRLESQNPKPALDSATQTVFAVAATVSGGLTQGRILAFAANASGDTAPLRVIEGSNTQLNLASPAYISGLSVDSANGRLLVAINRGGSGSGNSRLLSFPMLENGNVAPLQVISGSATGMTGVGAPFWLPDRILRTGLDP